MREFFIGLCAFAVIGGILLRSFVNEKNYARMFSLISGVLILVIIISVIPELRGDITLDIESDPGTEEQNFDGVVISLAEERLSNEAEGLIQSVLGVKGEVTVSLSYLDERIEVSCVRADVDEDARDSVRKWLCEYFKIEEGAVNFN